MWLLIAELVAATDVEVVVRVAVAAPQQRLAAAVAVLLVPVAR